MGRWKCKNPECAAVIDNHDVTRPEDSLREVKAEDSGPCPMCDQRAGFDNLNYRGIIVPENIRLN
jgi:hypothetical protein